MLVMGVTAAIVVMGWRLYGPSAAQTKELALRGVELVESWLRSPDDARGKKPAKLAPLLLPEPSNAAPGEAPPLLARAPTERVASSRTGRSSDQPERDLESNLLANSAGAQTVAPDVSALSGAKESERKLDALFAELTQLDVQEPKLAPWGTSGQLYRFCCRATWGESPQLSRHFESVAAEPSVAVEKVLAQVTSWRATATTPR
jgi:hypothetical protein